jgi:hypothetical protein
MEMFEWREKISGTHSPEEKLKLTHEILEIIGYTEKVFQSSLDEKKEEKALKTAIKLKYYSKVIHPISLILIIIYCFLLLDVGRVGYVAEVIKLVVFIAGIAV